MPVSFVPSAVASADTVSLVRALEQPALRPLDLDEVAQVAGVEDELLLVGAPA